MKVSATDGTVVEKTPWTIECNFGHDDEVCEHDDNHSHHSHNIVAVSKRKINERNNNSTALANGDYRVIALPGESPSHSTLTLVNSPWNDNLNPAAHPFDWHNDGSTTRYTTRGNNVWAVEDRDANNNQNTGSSPDSQLGTSGQQYNFVPNFNQAPATYQDAALTNLFYWNNIVHDITYHYGFDEASGNFQETNNTCLLYTSPSPRDKRQSRMPSSA